jgi:phosphate starvation-inducible PhoH-like protein
LRDAIRRLRSIDGVAFVTLDQSDIVRHRLVQKIVEAYENQDRNRDLKGNESKIVRFPAKDSKE